MRTPTPKTIRYVLDTINWIGHIEISEADKDWLAAEIAAALSEDEALCGVCEELKPIVVQTAIGSICEDCIEEINDQAEQAREDMEDDS